MKNLKPSQLPEGTVIDDERYGEYIKRADGIWEEMDRNNLGDRERVTDTGYDKDGEESFVQFLRRTDLAHSDKSDDYFQDYKVVAVPPWFVFVGDAESIHGQLMTDDMYPKGAYFYMDGSEQHECEGYNCEF